MSSILPQSDDYKGWIVHLLAQESHFAVSEAMVFALGPTLTMVLSKLVDKYKYFDREKMLQRDGSFYLEDKYLTVELGISEDTLRRARRDLISAELLKVQRRGAPPRNYYSIRFKTLYCCLQLWYRQREEALENIRNNQIRGDSRFGSSDEMKSRKYQDLNLGNSERYIHKQNINKPNNPSYEGYDPSLRSGSTSSREGEEAESQTPRCVPPDQSGMVRTTRPGQVKIRKDDGPSRVELDEAVELYNDLAARYGFPGCRNLTGKRKGQLRQRLMEYDGLKTWKEVLSKVEQSSWLRSKVKGTNGWKVSIDFIIQPTSFAKLLEDFYYDGPDQSSSGKPANGNGRHYETSDELIEDLFGKDRVMVKAMRNLVMSAGKVVARGQNKVDLTFDLLKMMDGIRKVRKENGTKVGIDVPDNMELLEEYVEWLEDNQNKFSHRSSSSLFKLGGVFDWYIGDISRNYSRNPLTGR